MGVCDGSQDRQPERYLGAAAQWPAVQAAQHHQHRDAERYFQTAAQQTVPAENAAPDGPAEREMMGRATRIAMLARLYLLLGKHPEYLTANTGERIDRALDAPIPLNAVDKTLLMAATEIDRVCGYTVMLLRGQTSKPLLDALGVMDPDRIVAMYYALPDRRREIVKRDPAWAYHIEHEPEGLAAVMSETKDWIADMDRIEADMQRLDACVPAAVSNQLKRTERVMLQHQAGLPVMVSRQEREEIEASERAGKKRLEAVGMFVEEITALPDPTDEQAQRKAMRRVLARMG